MLEFSRSGAVLLSMVLASVSPGLFAQDTQRASLTDNNFAKWRDTISPTPEEMAWREIPWHLNLDTALAAGERSAKPILLWAMNGHPLGCV